VSWCSCARCESSSIVIANMKSTIEAHQSSIAALKATVAVLTERLVESQRNGAAASIALAEAKKAPL
jgi:hypothetical protein